MFVDGTGGDAASSPSATSCARSTRRTRRALDTRSAASPKKPLQTVARGRLSLPRHRPHGAAGLPPSRRTDAAAELTGAVTTRNLLRHRATTAIVLGDEIDSARSAAGLAQRGRKLPLTGAQPAGGRGRSAHDRGGHQRGDLRADAARRRAGARRAERSEGKGRTARSLRGARAGFGRPRRDPARSRPGQRHRLRDGRAEADARTSSSRRSAWRSRASSTPPACRSARAA